MKDIRKKLGERIRKIRLEKGLSQEVLAYGANLHRTYISDVERGERNISIKNIEKIAKALDINLKELFSD